MWGLSGYMMSKRSTDNLPYPANLMGGILISEVEKQLVNDLLEYNIDASGLKFDWSDIIQEGHCTSFMGGELESMSSVYLVDSLGKIIIDGWVDFIHGSETMPLNVFWLFLSVNEKNGQRRELKESANIPVHVWNKLSLAQRDLCANAEADDSKWLDDPLVIKWQQNRI